MVVAMNVLVTGGCGYIGSVLVAKLLLAGHRVEVIDLGWFGNERDPHSTLAPHHALRVYQQDIREVSSLGFYDAIIHLAGIANDPCGELDAKLTWEVNVLGTLRLAEAAVRSSVKQFIFASSASVYGLKGNAPVVETDSLEPVSDYNKTKQCAERVLRAYADQMAIQILRPATVCGVSPRQRLDTMVNMLAAQAYTEGEMKAHCGEEGENLMRPNIHIEDMTDLYVFMLDHPNLTGVFNAGFENISAVHTAEMIAAKIPSHIIVTKVKDKRSYAVDSSKLLAAGFAPRHTVGEAITDLQSALRDGRIKPADPRTVNLTWMRENGWVHG